MRELDTVPSTPPASTGWAVVPLDQFVAAMPLKRWRLVFEAEDDVVLPAFRGALWHSVLGPALKSVCCTVAPGICDGCSRRSDCGYPRLMEAQSPVEATDPMGLGARVPGPLILNAGPWRAERIPAGEQFSIDLAIVGRDDDLAEALRQAFALAAGRGLGRHRARARLIAAREVGALAGAAATAEMAEGSIAMDLVTPLRLKRRGVILRRFDLAALARDLSLRVAALGHYHGGLPWPAPWTRAMDEAREARVTGATRWVNAKRYSARQGRAIITGGLVGRVNIEGAGQELRRLLAAGEVLHAGKATSMGLGQFRLRPAGRDAGDGDACE